MNPRLAQLHSLVAARFPAAMQTHFSGVPSISGTSVSLIPGRLVEVVSPLHHAGSGLLLVHLAGQTSGPLAWIDAADSLDLASLPFSLRPRVLWLRGKGVKDSLKAADLILRDGNLQTLLIDLRLVPERQLFGLPSSLWHRLRMLAEKSQASVGVFTPFKTVGCAAVRWSVNAHFDLSSLHKPQSALLEDLQSIQQRGSGLALDADLSLQS